MSDNGNMWAAPVVMLAMAIYRNLFAGRWRKESRKATDDRRWLTAKQRFGVHHSLWEVEDWKHYYTAQRMKQEWLKERQR